MPYWKLVYFLSIPAATLLEALEFRGGESILHFLFSMGEVLFPGAISIRRVNIPPPPKKKIVIHLPSKRKGTMGCSLH